MKRPRMSWFACEFSVSGLNLERFINLVYKAQIPLLRAHRQDRRTLVCRCCSSDYAAIASIAAEKGWSIHRIRPVGLSAAGAFLKKRPGIPIGILLSVILLFTFSQFIWRIEIHNAGPYQADLMQYLNQSGLKPGTLRNHINAKALEARLAHRYPQLAWLHVYVNNVTLVVDVTAGVPMPALPSDEPAHLTASRDGVVESVQVFAGTAAVRPGDAVKKGQILIRGEERVSDGAVIPVHAEGIVMARCWASETVSIPLLGVHSLETGRQSVSAQIRTPFFSFPSIPDAPDYLASNLYMEETPIGGCFFPVTLRRITHREVAMEYFLRDDEQVRAEALEAALHRLQNRLQRYEIIDKWADYCMIEDESVSARVSAEWLMDIGGVSPP